MALTNASKQVVNTYAYDPYGRLMAKTETVQQPFQYAGQVGILAEGNNLYYMWARYYDANVGRFISEDPAGFEGGLNLYAYVGGNPIMAVDPSGLTQADVDRAQQILRDLHPEYYNPNAQVTFGNTSGQADQTNFFTGNITLSTEYAAKLTEDQQDFLLETLAHEYQHSNDGIAMRALTNIQDALGISGRHEEIYRNAFYNLNPWSSKLNPFL